MSEFDVNVGFDGFVHGDEPLHCIDNAVQTLLGNDLLAQSLEAYALPYEKHGWQYRAEGSLVPRDSDDLSGADKMDVETYLFHEKMTVLPHRRDWHANTISSFSEHLRSFSNLSESSSHRLWVKSVVSVGVEVSGIGRVDVFRIRDEHGLSPMARFAASFDSATNHMSLRLSCRGSAWNEIQPFVPFMDDGLHPASSRAQCLGRIADRIGASFESLESLMADVEWTPVCMRHFRVPKTHPFVRRWQDTFGDRVVFEEFA